MHITVRAIVSIRCSPPERPPSIRFRISPSVEEVHRRLAHSPSRPPCRARFNFEQLAHGRPSKVNAADFIIAWHFVRRASGDDAMMQACDRIPDREDDIVGMFGEEQGQLLLLGNAGKRLDVLLCLLRTHPSWRLVEKQHTRQAAARRGSASRGHLQTTSERCERRTRRNNAP